MPNLSQEKANTFGTISAFKTLLNDYPKLNSNNSLPSINNSQDPISFIVDLYSVLGSNEQLKNTIAMIIIQYLEFIELTIKEVLKNQIKENIACNINPSILVDMKNCGVYIPLKSIDMFNLMRKSPLDSDAKNFYFDLNGVTTVSDILNCKDFNAFLWYVINVGCIDTSNNAIGCTWGSQVNMDNLALIEFTEKGGYVGDNITCPQQYIDDNCINFKVHPDYPISPTDQDFKTLTDFNSDFIDSVKFFDKEQIIAQLFGRVFGSLDTSIQRTQEEIFLEQKINAIIDRLSNCTSSSETIIDDSYFSFSNEELNDMLNQAELRKNGVFKYSKDENLFTSLSSQDILNALEGFNQTTDMNKQEEIFSNAIDTFIDDMLSNNKNINPKDKYKFRINIIKSLIEELSSLLTMIVMSPKVYLLLTVNLKLLGIELNEDPISFIQRNINLISNIVSEIKDVILNKLMQEITSLSQRLAIDMANYLASKQLEKFRNIIIKLKPF